MRLLDETLRDLCRRIAEGDATAIPYVESWYKRLEDYDLRESILGPTLHQCQVMKLDVEIHGKLKKANGKRKVRTISHRRVADHILLFAETNFNLGWHWITGGIPPIKSGPDAETTYVKLSRFGVGWSIFIVSVKMKDQAPVFVDDSSGINTTTLVAQDWARNNLKNRCDL